MKELIKRVSETKPDWFIRIYLGVFALLFITAVFHVAYELGKLSCR